MTDPTFGPEQFSPEDFTDMVFPDGTYDAEIMRCESGNKAPTDKFDPNEPDVTVVYRVSSDDPIYDGKLYRPFSMVKTRGKNGMFKFWLRSLGVDINQPFTFNAEDWIGRKVQLRFGTKMAGQGTKRRAVNTLEEIHLID